jgi:hypothetical protein
MTWLAGMLPRCGARYDALSGWPRITTSGMSSAPAPRALIFFSPARKVHMMVSSVLPGLRELRAPLAAGYLWLVTAWLVLGDKLPTAMEVKPAPLDRLYRLEPVLSDVGLAVVASVVAYVVGSIAIDVQVRAGRWCAVVWNGLI